MLISNKELYFDGLNDSITFIFTDDKNYDSKDISLLNILNPQDQTQRIIYNNNNKMLVDLDKSNISQTPRIINSEMDNFLLNNAISKIKI